MQETVSTNTLLETKFYRPGLPIDMVQRPRLTAFLKKHQESCPVTLVSAPAGYGKSTLVSSWLEQVDCPTAWLSLDDLDNNRAIFLRYFLAAIQMIFPDKLTETEISLPDMPLSSSIPTGIANSLINEINQIGEFFILVLDDYHLIWEQSIHDFLNELLLYPPSNLHLVIVTRIDPPLSLVTLRGKGMLTEVRIPSLNFNQAESLRLIRNMTGYTIDADSLAKINDKAEGWVTGLRLATLAMRHRIGWEVLDPEFTLNNRYMREYLLSEIFVKQAATLTDWMLKTSILARFNTNLCEELCVPRANSLDDGSAESDTNGEQFIEWMRASNLFIIPLDDRHEWYRYHHIFKKFLQQELAHRFGQDEIRELHRAAGRWYAQKSIIDEALNHLLLSGDISAAIELVARHRYRMMNDARWAILENHLNLFPEKIIKTSPELWMLKIWLVHHRSQFVQLPALLQELDAILARKPDQEAANRLAGEIHFLRSLVAYHSSDGERAISQARMALELVPSELWSVRVLARVYLAGSLVMVGDQSGGNRAIYSGLEEEKVQNTGFRSTLLSLACYIHWVTADLRSMEQAANQSITLCLKSNFRQFLNNSYDHLGKVKYQHNDLPEAEKLFKDVVAKPYLNYGTAYVSSVCGLSMTYQAIGKEDEAQQVIEEAIAFLLDIGNTTQLQIIQALQAEIALKQGDLAVGRQWAANLGLIPPMQPTYGFLLLHLTLVRVWLAQDTPLSRAKAGELLSELQEYLEGTHNTRFLIETLANQAMLAQTLGDQETAQAKLTQALRQAQAGGFIRVFVDAGPEMARLFAKLQVDSDLRAYVGKIRSAFPGLHQTDEALNQGELLDPLTDRELQILELLQKRLSNKEIATQLVISSGTVKGHTIKIYQKLDVNSRRQAVEKAVALRLLMPI